MPELRKLLNRWFGYASLLSAGMFISLAPVLFRSPLPRATPYFYAEPVGVLFIAMRELILLMPPVVAIVGGMAWLALRKGAPSARRWAISASISFLVLSAPFLNADVAIMRYHVAGIIELGGVSVFFATSFLLGIAGLVAFGKRNARFPADPELLRVTSSDNGMGALASTL